MKIKSLISLIAVLLAVGFCGSALAVLDDTGDEICTNKDLLSTSVLYFDAGAGPAADSVKVTVGMNAGSSLPGLVMFEVDTDDDVTTGGQVSMVGVMKSCASGQTTKIKEQAGTDILVMIMIRDQTAAGGTAWCDGCLGSGSQCFERGAACAGECGGTDCYKAGAGCAPDSGPNCYASGDSCNEPRPTCDTCYELNVVCTSSQECNIGRRQGEWYADISAAGQGGTAPAAWGRIDMPLPDDTGTAGPDEYPLPWGRIVSQCYEKAQIAVADPAKIFDLAASQNPANFNYQLSVWEDVDDASEPANDFFNEVQFAPAVCAEVCDVVPNTGLASLDTLKVCTVGCNGDFDTDADVDGTDAVGFKAHFFRKNCLNADLRAR